MSFRKQTLPAKTQKHDEEKKMLGPKDERTEHQKTPAHIYLTKLVEFIPGLKWEPSFRGHDDRTELYSSEAMTEDKAAAYVKQLKARSAINEKAFSKKKSPSGLFRVTAKLASLTWRSVRRFQ